MEKCIYSNLDESCLKEDKIDYCKEYKYKECDNTLGCIEKMNNRELKELWKSNKESLRDVGEILLTKQHKFFRGRTGNVDLLLTFIPKQNMHDEDLVITVGGIYGFNELDSSICISKDENGGILFIK